MKRRKFLKTSTLGMVGAGVLSAESILKAEEAKQDNAPGIKEYRTLGRTGFKVSDISAGMVPDEGVLNSALDIGINYLDTAEAYMNGQCEKMIGNALKDRDRKKFFVTTKLITSPFFAKMAKIEDVSKEGILRRFYQSLERLQMDYVDCLMVHGAEINDLNNKDFHAAVKQLKSEGKLKFIGVSNHGSYGPNLRVPMEEVLLAAADDGRFDVFLMVYNYLKQNQADKIMSICKNKGIGVTLMKTNPVGSYFGMKEGIAGLKKGGKDVPEYMTDMFSNLEKKFEQAESFLKKYDLEDPSEIKDAAIKFCLNNSDVSSVVLTIKNFYELTNYVKLSGTRLTPTDNRALSAYSKSMGKFYCRHACGECEEKCPHGVPVNTIMRYNHYYTAQGREKYAMEKYAGLTSRVADQCRNCSGACVTACPYKVPIQALLHLAHQNLTLT